MQALYGEIMADWLEHRGYRVDHSAEALQKMTEQAHEHTEGGANQKSMSGGVR